MRDRARRRLRDRARRWRRRALVVAAGVVGSVLVCAPALAGEAVKHWGG